MSNRNTITKKNTHYPAVRCIEKRIEELNKEIVLSEKIMDNPEMMSDYHFAEADLKNFKSEISELQQTIESLIIKAN